MYYLVIQIHELDVVGREMAEFVSLCTDGIYRYVVFILFILVLSYSNLHWGLVCGPQFSGLPP